MRCTENGPGHDNNYLTGDKSFVIDREHYLFNNTVENYTVYTDYEKYGAKLNIVSNNAVGGQSTRVKI